MNTQTDKFLLAKQILRSVIVPALDKIGLGGRAAQELVLGTGIQESGLIYRRQLGGGPARGLWQMEARTFQDLWDGYVEQHDSIRKPLLSILHGEDPNEDALETHDQFAAAMCRIYYRRLPSIMPGKGELNSQAAYWKRYYNTNYGAGKAAEYVRNWGHYVNADTFLE